MHIEPLIEEVSIKNPPHKVFEAFKDEENAVFLDSGMDHKKLGRFSVIVSDPFLVFKAKAGSVEVSRNGRTKILEGNPLNILKKYFYKYKVKPVPQIPAFTAGAVGYFAYDLGWQLEKLPSVSRDDIGMHDMHLGFYDAAVIFDNLKKKYYITSTGFPEENNHLRQIRAKERIEQLKSKLGRPHPEPHNLNDSEYSVEEPYFSSNFSKSAYLTAVEKVKRHIARGDIYQANLSQRFTTRFGADFYELYRRLRAINPAPFASFLNLGEMKIISASPERFLRISGRDVTTRPIKGTRPRGRTVVEDRKLREELLSSRKDRAELVMIVDLERNDLGKVCDYGSVKVDELVTLEKYSTVFHLASTVRGRLHENKDHIDCIKAAFPGGSITGAPKIRAMEILEELEPTKRGIYTGSIGYLGFNQETDLNIVIRTMVIKDGMAYFHVGGGIVSDSDPEGEYQETLHKARALIEALHFIQCRKLSGLTVR